MIVSKLLDGVMVVEQGTSRRAFRPRFAHRIMLTWIFRYFTTLPMPVLTGWQRALVAAVMAHGVIVPIPRRDSGEIIGVVESATSPAAEGKPPVPSVDWEYVRRPAARDRASA